MNFRSSSFQSWPTAGSPCTETSPLASVGNFERNKSFRRHSSNDAAYTLAFAVAIPLVRWSAEKLRKWLKLKDFLNAGCRFVERFSAFS